MFYKKITSPVGNLTLVACDKVLNFILWENDRNIQIIKSMIKCPDHTLLCEAEKQLMNYFKGTLKRFNLPYYMIGTPFQKKVWETLLTIPYGQTKSYSEVAKLSDHARASRAVGSANRLNPLPILVPCHRVIGSNGSLSGFAGGHEAKRFLLIHEKILS